MPAAENVEIKFAQRLAANTKTMRDRAVRKLEKYLKLKSQKPGGGFTRDDMLKIWKGLFYCMWMSDKLLVQQELSQTLAKLIHSLENDKTAMLFFETFLATMNREWGGIDRLRMDKFYMLCRNMLQESLQYVKKKKWEEGLFTWWLAILSNNAIMTPSSPNGLAYHMADIYLEEITKAGKDHLNTDQVHKLLVPYCEVIAKTKEQYFLKYIYEHLFEEIIETSEIAQEVLIAETENIGHADCLPDEKPINIDFAKLSDTLQSCAKEENVLAFNVKKLYTLAKSFRELSEGRLPLDEFPDLSGSEDDEEEFNVEQSKLINRLVHEDEKAKRESKQLKRKKPKLENLGDEGDFVLADSTSSKQKDGSKANKKKAKITPTQDGDKEDFIPINDFYAQDNYILQQAEQRHSKKKSTLKRRKKLSALLDSDSEAEEAQNSENKRQKIDIQQTNSKKNDENTDAGKVVTNGHSKVSKKKKRSAKILNGIPDSTLPKNDNSFVVFSDTKPVASFFRASATKVQNKKVKNKKKTKVVTEENVSTPSSNKKVLFEMSKIQVQRFRKNDKSMCVSPSPAEVVAFDPAKKPEFGLLKKHKRFSK